MNKRNYDLQRETLLAYHIAVLRNGFMHFSQYAIAVDTLTIFIYIILCLISRSKGALYHICFSISSTIILLYSLVFSVYFCGYCRHAKAFYQDFIRIGLVNAAQEAPLLISEKTVCGKTILIFRCKGIPVPDWEDNMSYIQSALNLTVARIEEGPDHRTIILSCVPPNSILGSCIPWLDSYTDTNNSKYVLGVSLCDVVSVDISLTPHLLIGGSTGSGKTKLTELLINQALTKGEEVLIYDPKGIDYKSFAHHPKCRIIDNEPDFKGALSNVVNLLFQHKTYFAQHGTTDISELPTPLPRIFIVIDECAMLYDTAGRDKDEKALIERITKNSATIARMGRAFGIHLILATQRPDAAAVPGTIKSNIDIRICGKADATLSTIILGDGRANETIPKTSQGRFIMADGGDDIVFQAYYYK